MSSATRELDAWCGEVVMGAEPEITHIVTSDGGHSCVAGTAWNGPWHTREQLAAWLEAQQKSGLMKEYTLGEWKRWPRYSIDRNVCVEAEDRIQRLGLAVAYAEALVDELSGGDPKTLLFTLITAHPLTRVRAMKRIEDQIRAATGRTTK